MSIGKLRDGVYEFNTKCSICGKPRNAGGHRKCSKILQQRHRAENQPCPTPSAN